eukprot:scaffold161828_cov86-Attheya_sp.AAC.1
MSELFVRLSYSETDASRHRADLRYYHHYHYSNYHQYHAREAVHSLLDVSVSDRDSDTGGTWSISIRDVSMRMVILVLVDVEVAGSVSISIRRGQVQYHHRLSPCAWRHPRDDLQYYPH